jgi:hypothetical protein
MNNCEDFDSSEHLLRRAFMARWATLWREARLSPDKLAQRKRRNRTLALRRSYLHRLQKVAVKHKGNLPEGCDALHVDKLLDLKSPAFPVYDMTCVARNKNKIRHQPWVSHEVRVIIEELHLKRSNTTQERALEIGEDLNEEEATATPTEEQDQWMVHQRRLQRRGQRGR